MIFPRVCLPLLLVVGLMVLLSPSVPEAFVLPGKQVLALMQEKRIAPPNLEVRQVVSQLPIDGAPLMAATLRETLNYSFPDRFRADIAGENYRRISILTPHDRLVAVNGKIQSGPPDRFEVYKDILLIDTRQAMGAYLLQLGVDLDQSSLGRFEDRYCFVIGAHFPDARAAQLWVAKDTFRPMRLILPPPALNPQEGPLEVRFLDWGQIEGAAYPMLIQIFRKHQLVREMRVEGLRLNSNPDPVLFDTAGLRATLPHWVPEPIIAPPSPSPSTIPPPMDNRF